MISVTQTSHEKQKEELPQRLLELRKKIYDEDYLNFAVQRIAQVVSQKIVDAQDAFVLRSLFDVESSQQNHGGI